jgi:DDE_Tnp_1-associated/Transposase DDE domain
MVEREIRAVKKLLLSREDVLAFRGVKDPRRRRGLRWALSAVLAGVVLGIAATASSVRAVEQQTARMGAVGLRFGIRRRMPRSTIGRVIAEVEPTELQEHLARVIREEHRRRSLEPVALPVGCVALDGKSIRAVHRRKVNEDCQEVHPDEGVTYYSYRVFRAVLMSTAAKLCVGQMTVPAATNEMGCFQDFFGWLLRSYGRSDLIEVVFADSGSASEANARRVDEAQRGYVLALKGNQPELEAEAKRLLLPKMRGEAPEAQDEGWVRDHKGRWIQRRMWRTGEIEGYLGWPHLRQAIVVRTVRRIGEPDGDSCREEVLEDRYFVANLPLGHRLKGPHLLRAIRLYWQVEEYFCVADVELEEDDRPYTQVGNGVPVTTLLRILAQNLLALLRDVHLRAERYRIATWRTVRQLVLVTLWTAEDAGEETALAD